METLSRKSPNLPPESADWSAEQFVAAVRAALATGNHLGARHLSAAGAERFPEDERLQKMAYVLGPPKIIGRRPADPTIRLNSEWLRAHRNEHRGSWIALRAGELLDSGATNSDVRNGLGSLDGVLVTKIY